MADSRATQPRMARSFGKSRPDRRGMGPPITYELDGKQYISFMGGTGQRGGAGLSVRWSTRSCSTERRQCQPRRANSPQREGSESYARAANRSAPGAPELNTPFVWREAARLLQTEQAIDLDDERAVREVGKRARKRVTLLVVDDEQLAARTVLPPEARVGRNRAVPELYCTSALVNISGVIGTLPASRRDAS